MEAYARRGALLSIEQCAEKVRAGDPDRFLSVMAAGPDQRGALFVLYAFNLEIARAPWVSQEPMIAEMRLQFWRDVLDGTTDGAPSRAHEVAAPLSELIRQQNLPLEPFHQMIDARRWDIERQAFADTEAFSSHIKATSANLICLAVRALGPEADKVATAAGMGIGIANWLSAIPQLEAANRLPLVDGRAEAVQQLARDGLAYLDKAKAMAPPAHAMPTLRSGWMARSILRTTVRDPQRVGTGNLRPSEFNRRAGLMAKTVLRRW